MRRNEDWGFNRGEWSRANEPSLVDRVLSTAKYIISRTPIPAIILGASLGYFSGHKSYQHEKIREKLIPLGFSEVSQIQRDAMEQMLILGEGDPKDPNNAGISRTLYLSMLNDLTMKIFECWNTANANGGDIYKNFAAELKLRFDPEKKKHHYELTDLFEEVPQYLRAVRKQTEKIVQLQGSLPGIANLFSQTFSETHSDVYRTETRLENVTETVTDSDGNTHTETHTEIKTETVYDYTDHTYTYYRDNGNQASQSLDWLLSYTGDIRFQDKIVLASRTNADGERAALESRKKGDKLPDLSSQDLLNIANTWYTGSTITTSESTINGYWGNLHTDADNWRSAKDAAEQQGYWAYPTGSSTDSGPREYQITRSVMSNSNNLTNAISEVVNSIDETERRLPQLKTQIDYLISEAEAGHDCRKIAREVLKDTQGIYTLNFNAGLDVQRFRPGMIALWSILGAAAGVAAGFGATYLGQRARFDE